MLGGLTIVLSVSTCMIGDVFIYYAWLSLYRPSLATRDLESLKGSKWRVKIDGMLHSYWWSIWQQGSYRSYTPDLHHRVYAPLICTTDLHHRICAPLIYITWSNMWWLTRSAVTALCCDSSNGGLQGVLLTYDYYTEVGVQALYGSLSLTLGWSIFILSPHMQYFQCKLSKISHHSVYGHCMWSCDIVTMYIVIFIYNSQTVWLVELVCVPQFSCSLCSAHA